LRQKLYYDFLLSICENFGREYGILGKRKAEVIIEAKAIL
jgi:hypothetical protein